jgi:hypothetical protein
MRVYLCTVPWIGSHGSPFDVGKAMRIYLSMGGDIEKGATKGSPSNPLRRPLRLLLSYYYYKDEDIDAILNNAFGDLPDIELDLFADSGAYSAFTSGDTIDEEAYITWAEKWLHRFSAVCGPDVIGDPLRTQQATERMRQRITSKPVLPTFHVGEDWKHLDYWVGKADYIALGGMVPYGKQRDLLGAWIAKAFSRLNEGMKVHGFGMTSWPLLRRFPWYSVDSSSWTIGFRYALLMLFDSRRGTFETVAMNDPHALLKYSSLLAQYGLRSTEAHADTYDRDFICGVSVEAWQRAEEWMENDRKRRAAVSPSMFLACGASWGEPNRLGLPLGRAIHSLASRRKT